MSLRVKWLNVFINESCALTWFMIIHFHGKTCAQSHTQTSHVLCEGAWLICMCERAHIFAYIFACILACVSELTYKWVMRPHTTHIRMRDVTHRNESRHTYEWVTSHVRMSHVTRTNESCHTYKWVMSHIRMSHGKYAWTHKYKWVMRPHTAHIGMSHVAHTNESRHTQEWVMSHTQSCHTYECVTANKLELTRINESCALTQHTYEWVTAHIRMGHVTRTNESRHTYERVMSHIRLSHVTHTNKSRKICLNSHV